jgi:hypothetical protein
MFYVAVCKYSFSFVGSIFDSVSLRVWVCEMSRVFDILYKCFMVMSATLQRLFECFYRYCKVLNMFLLQCRC